MFQSIERIFKRKKDSGLLKSELDAASFGRLLRSKNDVIIETFLQQVRGEVPGAVGETRAYLKDHLPDVLKEIGDFLKSSGSTKDRKESSALAKEHGLQRARGEHFTLEDLRHEYSILRRIILAQIPPEQRLSENAADLFNDVFSLTFSVATENFVRNSSSELLENQSQVAASENQHLWFLEAINRIPKPLFLLDFEKQQISYSNLAARKMLGLDYADYKREAAIGTAFRILDVDGRVLSIEEAPSQRTLNGESLNGDEVILETLTGRYHLKIFSEQLPERYGQPRSALILFQDITQMKQTEAELRKTESDLREAVDIAQVGFWTLDVATNRITVTPILLKQFGINIETFKGTLEEAVAAMHPDDRQTVVDLIELAVYKGKEYHTEYRVIHPDGSIHWVEAKGVTTYDNKESPIKFTGTTLDITDRKTAEEAIQRATKKAFAERTKFEEVLAQAAIPIALFEGADHRFTMANPNFIESFGTLGSPVGKTITEVFPDAVEQGFRSLLDAVYKTGQTFTGKEVPFNRTAGIWPARNFFLDFAYIAKRNAENQIEGVLVVAVDVTESVTAKRALEENALELKTLADSMPQIVWGARPDGTLDYFNQVWFDYSGSTRKENEGMGWTKFVHEDDLPSTVANWTQSLKTEQMYENEFRLRSGTGEYRWHFARAVPVRDLNGSIIKWYGTNTDIHDQVVLRKDLSDAKFVAEKANAAKSQFLANMSHEIRTPLGAIMGFASILRDQTYSKTETDGFVSVIERNSNQLLRIIDDILDLSKVEAGMVQIEHIDFSLPEMLSDFSSLLGFKAREKGISFSFRAVTPLPKLINSDPTRIRQILMNVVGNAIKFTDKGSVEVRVAYEDGFLDFDVEDSGTGITPEQELNLFQPFSQADTSITRKFGGTGLGLVLTRSLAEALGGYFVLKSSTAGKGSTFSVRVKVQVEANAEFVKGLGFESTPPTPAAPIGQLAGLKVLVVEDSPDNQALLSIFLARSGARTDIATDGRQGVNAALGGDYDVVLMDVQMPVLDGINAVKELRQRGYKGPVVALTAHAMKEERIRCLQAGYNEFLSKPVTRDDLVALLSRYL